jgi:hypothetical protein
MAESDLQTCVRTTLPIDRAMEESMANWLWTTADKLHRDLGYGGAPNAYIFDSHLWKRLSAMNRFEGDFSDRVHLPAAKGGELYKLSNRSLNFPQQFVRGYHAGATADLSDHGFFKIEPEGGEDEHPAMELWQRYLREQAKRMRLGVSLKNDCALPMLVMGEQVASVRKKRKVLMEPRIVKAVRDLRELDREVPLKDSKGVIVTELDAWQPDPRNPERKLLTRDTKVWRSASVPLQLTTRTYPVNHVIHQSDGACVEFIHPGDFVYEQVIPCLDDMDCVGHFFSASVDDLFDQFDQSAITPAGELFRATYGIGSGSTGEQTNAIAPKTAQGESPNAADNQVHPGSMPRRRYFAGYFRYDWNGDGRRERVYCVLDWVTKTPICYDPTSLVLESDTRLHPYLMLAVRRKTWRAVGTGVYEQFNDLSEDADQKYNRIQLEESSSGKIIGFNRDGFTQTKAGAPLKFRGPVLYQKSNPQDQLKDIVDVLEIPAVTGELRENLALAVQTMTARGGGITPGEAEQAALPAAQTATGLQILQQQKNKLDGSIEDDLQQEILNLLALWSTVEAAAFDEQTAAKLFKGKTVEMPNPAFAEFMAAQAALPAPPIAPTQATEPGMEAPSLPESPSLAPQPPPETIPVSALAVLRDWLKSTHPDDLRNIVKLVLAKSKEAEVAARVDNRVKLITQYSQLTPQLQTALESEYIELLTLNGSQSAETTLKAIQQATQEALLQMQAQEGLPPAEGGAAAAPDLAPVSGEERVPTGRPEFNREIDAAPIDPAI